MYKNIIDLFTEINPIIQAPMAGVTNPRLVAAVSNSGAVGSFGFAYSSVEKIYTDLKEARELTKKPINANLFIFKELETPSNNDYIKAIETLQNLPINSPVEYTIPSSPFYPELEEQLEPIWEYKPELLTFHFGIPAKHIIEKAHLFGMLVGVTATCLREAQAIESSGVDFIVAQGIEAGGHRGTFEVSGKNDAKLNTLALLRSLTTHCRIPIIAAGGIMEGKDINNAINNGALAVQMGTAFLCCDEAGKSSLYREALWNQQEREIIYTKGFSGRWAQGIKNEFITLMDKQYVLPFPLQNTLTNSLRSFAEKTNNMEYQSLWVGKEYKKIRSLPASKLIGILINEMQTIL